MQCKIDVKIVAKPEVNVLKFRWSFEKIPINMIGYRWPSRVNEDLPSNSVLYIKHNHVQFELAEGIRKVEIYASFTVGEVCTQDEKSG